MSKSRFRQKPRGDMPFMVHPGEPPPNRLQNPAPISPSASSQRNADEQRRQAQGLHESTVKPQRVDPTDAPLFTSPRSSVAEAARETRVQQHQHHSGVTPVDHPGASPQQKPNDAGRSSKVPG